MTLPSPSQCSASSAQCRVPSARRRAASAQCRAVSSSAQRRDVCPLQGRQPSAQRKTPSVRCAHNPAFARAFFWSCPLVSLRPCTVWYSFFFVYTFHVSTHTHGSSASTSSRAVCSLFAPDSPFMSFFPPCLLFPDGHFETTFLTATATSSTSPATSPPFELDKPQKREVRALRPEQPGVWPPARHHAHHRYEPRLKLNLKKKSISEDSDATPIDDQNLDNFSEFSRVTRCADSSVSHVSFDGVFCLKPTRSGKPRAATHCFRKFLVVVTMF